MHPIALFVIVSSISLGTSLAFASSYWILAWIGLEINTLAMLPLMSQAMYSRPVEAATKYFLAQAVASALILFAIILNAWMTGQWTINTTSDPIAINTATLGLAMKLGVAPLHIWLPEVMQGVTLTTGLILSTWQKLAPYALLAQLTPHNQVMLLTMGLLSTLVGGWGGLNQTQLRKLLAYSSIAHLGWVLLILQFSKPLAFVTLITYFITTFSVFTLSNMYKATTINSLSMAWTKAPALTALTPLIILSLGGLPPLTGFGPKWMIMFNLSMADLSMLAVLAAFSSLISLYFYLRLTYTLTLMTPPNITPTVTSWRLTNLNPTMRLAIPATLALVLLPVLPDILSMLF